jgi:hypothetical protein
MNIAERPNECLKDGLFQSKKRIGLARGEMLRIVLERNEQV